MAHGNSSIDLRMMEECLRLAEKGRGYVSPNPLVGAVLADGNRILARGYHRRFGGDHAERDCLRRYHGDTRGKVLYVNLEPCVHYGKTPPCTGLIIHSGIRRVVVGMKDPNPRVAGRGIARLRHAGIAVVVGIRKLEASQLNREFATHIRERIPYIHIKLAQSLDGRIAGRRGANRWISSLASRRLVHRWRAEHDAILVGAGTVRKDDPALTVRLVRGRNPDVIVLDGNLSTPLKSRVYSKLAGRQVFVCVDRDVAAARKVKVAQLSSSGVTVLRFGGKNGILPISRVLARLYRHDIGSVLVEGGGEIYRRFLQAGLCHKLSIFVAPKLVGDGLPAFPSVSGVPLVAGVTPLGPLDAKRVGEDVLLQIHPKSRRGKHVYRNYSGSGKSR
jgi:diaminohydroxyphosphoribosylaminopyrimidine deaminase / 5-amino-6-(5-phosphoribosylamino)uracil reductase